MKFGYSGTFKIKCSAVSEQCGYPQFYFLSIIFIHFIARLLLNIILSYGGGTLTLESPSLDWSCQITDAKESWPRGTGISMVGLLKFKPKMPSPWESLILLTLCNSLPHILTMILHVPPQRQEMATYLWTDLALKTPMGFWLWLCKKKKKRGGFKIICPRQ